MELQVLSRFLSPRQISDLTGLSLVTIWRMRRRGELPQPIKLSPGRVAWPEETIRQWLEQRAAAGR